MGLQYRPGTQLRCVVSVVFKLSTSRLVNALARTEDIASAVGNHVRYVIPQPAYAFSVIDRLEGKAQWTTRNSLDNLFIVYKQTYVLADVGYYTAAQVSAIQEYTTKLASTYGLNHVMSNFEPTNTNLADTVFAGLGQRDLQTESQALNAVSRRIPRKRGDHRQAYEDWQGVPGAHPSIPELEELEKDWAPPITIGVGNIGKGSNDTTLAEEREIMGRAVGADGTCWYMTTTLIYRAYSPGQMVAVKYTNGCDSTGHTN